MSGSNKKRYLSPIVVSIVCGLFLGQSDAPIRSFETFEKQRGVSWVAGRRLVTEENFQALAKSGVNWIVQVPFGWQDSHDSPSLRFHTDRYVMWGERDEGIEITTNLARKFGIKTLLKPHVWLRRSRDKWRGDIRMTNEEDWRQWFENYRAFIMHYAGLAERLKIEGFCIGTELHGTVADREADWRDLIASVRSIYSGKLVYAANWYKEFEEVKFWDQLDFIGIQAYFPLASGESPTMDEIKSNWKPHLNSLHRISKKYGKPILFTEIGYRSTPDGAMEPWKWLARGERRSGPVDLQTQANCYEAFFQTFWHLDWFAGSYIWKWYPQHQSAGGPDDRDFTPQNKIAENVMAKWYSQ